MTMSDRLAVMRHGRIEQIGGPEDVYEHPATEFVAGFLGASNLLDGEVVERSTGVAFVRLRDGSRVALPDARLNGSGPAVRVGVRPEKIRLERDEGPAPDGWNHVTGTLRVATFVGVSHQYTVDGPDGRTFTVYAQNLGAESVPSAGERVRLTWRPEHTFAVRPMQAAAVREGEDE